MIIIKKNDPKYKKWLKRRNEKLFLKEVERRRHKSHNTNLNSEIKTEGSTRKVIKHTNSVNKYNAIAPEYFSIIENTNETVSYFNRIISLLRAKKYKVGVYFDIENVNHLTIDSVMYLLAIIKNIKTNKLSKYSFSGNFPKDKNINLLLNESGFLNYVTTKNKINLTKKGNNIEIKNGKQIDQNVAKETCDFVNKILKTDTKYTKFLYNMLIELMTNTFQHAYTSDCFLINHWYLFAENGNNSIKFIFLDTGLGIPNTIRKKFYENILPLKDNQFIYSALIGEFRTNTQQGYRGKGLPKIYQYYNEHTIKNLAIISGKGCCILQNSNYDMDNILNGTLFYWEISKNIEGNDIRDNN